MYRDEDNQQPCRFATTPPPTRIALNSLSIARETKPTEMQQQQTNERVKTTETMTSAMTMDKMQDDTSPTSPSVVVSTESLQEPYASMAKEALDESVPAIDRVDDLEASLRSHLLNLCQEAGRSNSTTTTTTPVEQCFMDSIQLCVLLLPHLEAVRSLPFFLFQDIAEALPSSQDLLSFYKNVCPIRCLCQATVLWEQTTVPSTGKPVGQQRVVQLIRACNQWLVRLPARSEWTGRVLTDLANVLPLSDRSGIGRWGSVSEYRIEYEKGTDDDNDTTAMDVTDADESGLVDKDFYQQFWAIQSAFANPYGASFDLIVKSWKAILTQLEGQRPSKTTTSSSIQQQQQQQHLQYLTSRRSLAPQLDPTDETLLQQHVLTQFCIVESFLSTQSAQLAPLMKPLSDRTYKLLDPERVRQLRRLLTDREPMWRHWKKNRQKPDLATLLSNSIVPTTDDDDDDDDTNKRPIDALTFLKPLSMEELQKVSKDMSKSMPQSMETYLEDYVEALDPEAGIEAQYSPKGNKIFCWQALRFLAKSHLCLFDQIRSNGDFEGLVRQVYQTQLDKSIPGDMPVEEVFVDPDAVTTNAVVPKETAVVKGGSADADKDKKEEETVEDKEKASTKETTTTTKTKEETKDADAMKVDDDSKKDKPKEAEKEDNPGKEETSEKKDNEETMEQGDKDKSAPDPDAKDDKDKDDAVEELSKLTPEQMAKRYEGLSENDRLAKEEEDQLKMDLEKEQKKRKEEEDHRKMEMEKEEKKRKAMEEEEEKKRKAKEQDVVAARKRANDERARQSHGQPLRNRDDGRRGGNKSGGGGGGGNDNNDKKRRRDDPDSMNSSGSGGGKHQRGGGGGRRGGGVRPRDPTPMGGPYGRPGGGDGHPIGGDGRRGGGDRGGRRNDGPMRGRGGDQRGGMNEPSHRGDDRRYGGNNSGGGGGRNRRNRRH